MKKLLLLSFFAIVFSAKFASAQAQLSNSGFETWSGSPSQPVGWVSTGGILGVANVNLSQDQVNFIEGTSSAKLRTDSIHIPAAGLAFLTEGDLRYGTGVFNILDTTITYYGTPFTSRPDSVTFWYRCIPVGGDSGGFNFRLTHWNGTSTDIIGGMIGTGWLLGTGGNWVYQSHGINYSLSVNPDTVICNMHSSAHTQQTLGTEIWFDNIKLVYNSAGVLEHMPISSEMSLYPNPATVTLRIASSENFNGCKADIYDVSGKWVMTVTLYNNAFNVAILAKGHYLMKLTDSAGKVHNGKFEVIR